VVGCAVKADATDLALAVQQALNERGTSGALGALFTRAKLVWRQP